MTPKRPDPLAPPARSDPTSEPPAEPDYYAMLSPRHQRFVDGIVAGLSQTQAYIQAGYSPDGASANASLLIANHSKIALALEQQRGLLSARSAYSREQFIADLKALVEADGAEMFDGESFDIRKPAKWPLPLRRLLQGIEQSPRGLKVRLSDRMKARELLGRALGFFEQESRGSQFVLIIQAPPDANEPRPVGQEIPLAPGITLQMPGAAGV